MINKLAFVLMALGCAAPASEAPDPTDDIAAMLDASASAWNRRDFEAFTGDYANEPTTTFVSGGRVQHGADWIRENYAPTFAPDAVHDSLRFEDLEVRALGNAHALATARFILFRGDSTTAEGPFTLILRKRNGSWRIIHDHTS